MRGVYDLAGMRADADYMVWWHADNVEALQAAYADLRRTTALGRASVPVWSQVALHRPGRVQQEPRPGVPGRRGAAALRLRLPVRPLATTGTCCPTRSAGRCSPTTARPPAATRTCAPTRCPSFALGDYEWILAFEADELHRIVDLMRDLRATEARRHVREEVPFFTGPRVQVGDLVATLP